MRQTIFFRNGGGLLLIALVVASIPITTILFPTIQSLNLSSTQEKPIFETAGTSFELKNPKPCSETENKGNCQEWRCGAGTGHAVLYENPDSSNRAVLEQKYCEACGQTSTGVICQSEPVRYVIGRDNGNGLTWSCEAGNQQHPSRMVSNEGGKIDCPWVDGYGPSRCSSGYRDGLLVGVACFVPLVYCSKDNDCPSTEYCHFDTCDLLPPPNDCNNKDKQACSHTKGCFYHEDKKCVTDNNRGGVCQGTVPNLGFCYSNELCDPYTNSIPGNPFCINPKSLPPGDVCVNNNDYCQSGYCDPNTLECADKPSGDACSGISGYTAATMACNTNFYGGDYYFYPNNDPNDIYTEASPSGPNQCQASCDDNARCRAWTFVKAGYAGSIKGKNTCYLKDSPYTENKNQDCCISGAKGTLPPPPPSPTSGGGGSINVSYQCSGNLAEARVSWSPDPSQLQLWVNINPSIGQSIEKIIDITPFTKAVEPVRGLPANTYINYAIIGPEFVSLRNNQGRKSPNCAAPTQPPLPTATTRPLPTATTSPVSRPNPTATTAPGQPTATSVPGQPTATPTNLPGQPTSTPAPAPDPSKIAVSIGVVGVGPAASIGQNPNPIRRSLPVQIQVFDSKNQKVKEASGNVNFNTGFNIFMGEIEVGALEGDFTAKVRLNNSLLKRLPGILSLRFGQTSGGNNIVEPVLGDLDQNNEINLVDYNLLISCYETKQCGQKEKADLNLDGKVNELDLNILYSSFAKRQGD